MRGLGSIVAWIALGWSWVLIFAYVSYYVRYSGTLLVALKLSLFFAAINSALALRYIRFRRNASARIVEAFLIVFLAAGLLCAAYDLWLRNGGAPLVV